MPRPVHFELSADDPERAVTFYTTVFGWKFDKWSGPFDYWVITTGTSAEPGIDGGMSRRQLGRSGQNTIAVDSLDDFLAKIASAGGTVVEPKGPIPGVGWFARCRDTEGNEFGMLEPDSAAK